MNALSEHSKENNVNPQEYQEHVDREALLELATRIERGEFGDYTYAFSCLAGEVRLERNVHDGDTTLSFFAPGQQESVVHIMLKAAKHMKPFHDNGTRGIEFRGTLGDRQNVDCFAILRLTLIPLVSFNLAFGEARA